ncbi:hypothetical protein RMN57_13155 [Kitasatospora sp. CM 4170]|uniref:Uncharacterized protein n=1 Tax=Kitasatospora aburaviensis TaxID=67265 RepID=A0ABW1F5U7_9ACTN|nr:hypothetical protein [Kitasatospora sp. CM 4170]WNM45602.1 hypothetical protein RMN57_13155 [Kitasatospora sp. CM 4170]
MSDPRATDDSRTDTLLANIRDAADLPCEFVDVVEGALTEGLAGRYDGTYPPTGHTYPET